MSGYTLPNNVEEKRETKGGEDALATAPIAKHPIRGVERV